MTCQFYVWAYMLAWIASLIPWTYIPIISMLHTGSGQGTRLHVVCTLDCSYYWHSVLLINFYLNSAYGLGMGQAGSTIVLVFQLDLHPNSTRLTDTSGLLSSPHTVRGTESRRISIYHKVDDASVGGHATKRCSSASVHNTIDGTSERTTVHHCNVIQQHS